METLTDVTGAAVTRSKGTEQQYAGYVRTLLAFALPNENDISEKDWTAFRLESATRWFVAQNTIWAKSTIKSYRRALKWAVERCVSNPERYSQIMDLLDTQVEPVAKANKGTASGKRKSISRDEHQLILRSLNKSKQDDFLIACFLELGRRLGLRPMEYLTAKVEEKYLVVLNAKSSNGRGNGVTRTLDLSSFSDNLMAPLLAFLENLKQASIAAGSGRALLNRLSARLARVCARLRIKRVCLYTIRHVALATAKRELSVRQVAALAGHASCVTATRHYAKRSSGWKSKVIARPSAESVLAVQDDAYRTSRDESVAANRNKSIFRI
ncbi:site-specific integrase [Devosia sp. MC532]|uniref:site-specific integrase n=1 Tax=Devosia sp. MC532 TaxID=2799788 RepID=UPI0018F54770|nr:site-specific integrase [Devosia sp. MC532]MBJ7578248.1 site-specific integrase [Devosia sp. MC532]